MLRRHLRLSPAVAALAWLVASGGAPARGDFSPTVTATVTPEVTGLYLYTYTITDPATSSATVSEFDLPVLPNATLTALTAPAGFLNTYTPGDPDVTFLSTDPSTDIPVGGSGTFTLESPFGPDLAAGSGPTADTDPAFQGAFLIRGFDAAGAPVQTAEGATILSPVPEPSGLVLGALGALVLAGYRRHRRRAATA